MGEGPRGQQRKVRKIRYHDDEWKMIVARARECRRPPARYVREVSLGFFRERVATASRIEPSSSLVASATT